MVDGMDRLGINHVLVQIYADHTDNSPIPTSLKPPRVSVTLTKPWVAAGGGKFHYATMDLTFWRNFDAMLEMFAQKNMVAHVMFYVGNKNVPWPTKLSPVDDIYWRSVATHANIHRDTVA